MWFMYGLKAQKLLAQGIALGIMVIGKAPCKGKSLKMHLIKMENPLRYVKLLPLQGARFATHKTPGRCPGLRGSAPSGVLLIWASCLQGVLLAGAALG